VPAEAANPFPTLVAALLVIVAAPTASFAVSIKDVPICTINILPIIVSQKELGVALESGHSSNLGKYYTGLVLYVIGSKIPDGLNISSAKSHFFKT